MTCFHRAWGGGEGYCSLAPHPGSATVDFIYLLESSFFIHPNTAVADQGISGGGVVRQSQRGRQLILCLKLHENERN